MLSEVESGRPGVREPGPKYLLLCSLKAHRLCLFLLKTPTLINNYLCVMSGDVVY